MKKEQEEKEEIKERENGEREEEADEEEGETEKEETKRKKKIKKRKNKRRTFLWIYCACQYSSSEYLFDKCARVYALTKLIRADKNTGTNSPDSGLYPIDPHVVGVE